MYDSHYGKRESQAETMFNEAMDNVYHKINVAKDAIEELSVTIDDMTEAPSDTDREKMEELISKALLSLCSI